MAAERRCSECGGPLGPEAPPNKLTCKAACRAARKRRLDRAEKQLAEAAERGEHYAALTRTASGDLLEVGKEVIQEELRPIVREQITEEVIKSLADMMALAPSVVAAMKEDIEGELDEESGEMMVDPERRQKAYALFMKHVLGAKPIQPKAEEESPNINVHFNLPRPGAEPIVAESPTNPEALEGRVVDLDGEQRTCDHCHQTKDTRFFVGQSERCQECHDQLRDAVLGKFPPKHDDDGH